MRFESFSHDFDAISLATVELRRIINRLIVDRTFKTGSAKKWFGKVFETRAKTVLCGPMIRSGKMTGRS